MTQALLALGSNVGDPHRTLQQAVARLGQSPKTKVLAVASFRQTQPVGCAPGTAEFVNSAVKIETSLGAADLLRELLTIEQEFGRVRAAGERPPLAAPRTLDMDLLLFGQTIMSTPELVIPHPRMHERLFVLEPAAEIAPEWVHPLFGRTLGQLLQEGYRNAGVER